MDKMSFFIQRLVCLGHVIVILLVRRHVNHFVRDAGILRVALIYFPVRRLHKSILVDARIGRQRVDQTDIGSLRRLDGTHSSIMGIVNISHLKSGPVTGQTSRSKSRQTSLVGQFTQRVILIHELRQLGGTEEFLHRGCNRFNIDQRLGRDSLNILGGHSLAHHALQSGKTDPVLILQQLAHSADSSVSQMVNIVIIAQPIFQMDIIVNGCQNILFCNMLWNQIMDIPSDRLFNIVDIIVLFQNAFQHRIIYQFRDSYLFRIHVHKIGDIHHHAGEHLDIALFCLYPHKRNRRVLNRVSHLFRHCRTLFCDDLTGCDIHHILSQHMAGDTVSKQKLFIEFVTSHLSQIITAGIEKHTHNEAFRTLHRQRLAGTDFFIQFKKAFLIIGGSILRKAGEDLRFFTEHLHDFRVRTDTKGTDQYSDRNLSGSVHTHIKHIVGIRFVFQPCSPVWNNGGRKQPLSDFIMCDRIVYTGGSH